MLVNSPQIISVLSLSFFCLTGPKKCVMSFVRKQARKPLTILKNVYFWNMSPCGSYRKRRFGGTCDFHLLDENNSSETSVSTRTKRRRIPEDEILHSRRRGIKSTLRSLWQRGVRLKHWDHQFEFHSRHAYL
jgi:hypothetical protein